MDDADDSVLAIYSKTLEMYWFEQTAANFHENEVVHYPTVLEQLRSCQEQLETLVASETDNSPFIVYLFQLQQQVSISISNVERRILEETEEVVTTSAACFIGSKRPYNASLEVPIGEKKKRSEEDVEDSDNERLLSIVRSTKQEPRVRGLAEIIGLRDIKGLMKSILILPKNQPQLFQNRRICNSVLLFGPPGTGKTRFAHGLAAETKCALHCISASDVLSHYVGQTEKTIKTLFQYMRETYDYSILFIDEVDGFCRKRTEGEQEHTRRIKTELMCQMSDIENCKNLFLICATNCPWDLDCAILRRFQKRIYVPLPNRFDRFELLHYFTKDVEGKFDEWCPVLDKTEGYSGSDLSNVVQTALDIPLTELENNNIWRQVDDNFFEPTLWEDNFETIICCDLSDLPPNSVRARKVTMADFLVAVNNVAPTISKADLLKYEAFIGL